MAPLEISTLVLICREASGAHPFFLLSYYCVFLGVQALGGCKLLFPTGPVHPIPVPVDCNLFLSVPPSFLTLPFVYMPRSQCPNVSFAWGSILLYHAFLLSFSFSLCPALPRPGFVLF